MRKEAQVPYSVQRFRGGFAIVYKDEDGRRVRQKLQAGDRPGAEAEARLGWSTEPGAEWLTGRIVNAYMADREAAEIASTARQKDAWKAMRPFWENVRPELIDRAMAQSYAERRGMSDATLRYELGMLAVALRWAEKTGKITKAPEVWRPEPPERRVRHLTRVQFDKWFDQVKAPHARLYVELGLATMARPSAILELQWPQVDVERELSI